MSGWAQRDAERKEDEAMELERLRAEVERLTRERDEAELILKRTFKYIEEKLPLKGAHSVFENIDTAVAERDQLREQLAALKGKEATDATTDR